MNHKTALGLSLSLLVFLSPIVVRAADAPAEVPLDKVKQVPPPGVKLPEAARDELEAGVAQLGKEIESVRAGNAMIEIAPGIATPVVVKAATLLPDVEIFYNAVRYALVYNEFFNVGQGAQAKVLLQDGMDRIASLKEGQAPWIHSPGLVLRGYVSKIDGSVQPYGLVIPASFAVNPFQKRRLDIWYHGRGETLNEISFLSGRRKSVGEFSPNDDTIILHPYGRYCNGNRFAGEVDTFEAMENVKKNYAIDDNRILVRGFSMGGASTWMMATHHPGMWAAAAPGAGFTETAGFLRITDLKTVPWYQQKLWHLYDSVDYAINLYNCPTVAYSGELDAQKQAADMMEKALAAEGIDLVQIIGAKAHHHYTPAAKEEINRRLDSIVGRGRIQSPFRVKFTTWTLRYNSVNWLTIDRLEHHWQRARVDAQFGAHSAAKISTENVAAFTLAIPPGYVNVDIITRPKVTLDDQTLEAAAPLSDRSWTAHFQKVAGKWELGAPADTGLHKIHGLQGPIDDAFMDSFIMVSPTGKPLNEKTAGWVKKEEAHAIDHWRKQFRGEARVKEDSAITDADIAASNLVLWGDPSSNAILAKIADKLPIHWNAQAVQVGAQSYPAASSAAILIYPNPLNPKKYVVLNSGFTFREYDYENNDRQAPKLPDWAVVNVDIAPTGQTPGGIDAAGFFDESWELEKPQ